MKCKNCGNVVNDNNVFCPNCGQKVEKPRKSNSKLVIIIVIILCLLLLFVIGLFIGKTVSKNSDNDIDNEVDKTSNLNDSNNEENEYTFNFYNTDMPREVKDEKDISKNIEIYNVFFNPNSTTGKIKEAYVYGKNNNDTSVKVNIEVEYYDAEGYRIDSDSAKAIVSPGSEFVLCIYVKDDSIKYKTTKLFYFAEKVESYYTVIDLNNIEANSILLNDNNIDVYLKNNSNVEIKSANLGCVYYKDGKAVFASYSYVGNINSNETGKAIFYDYKLNLKPYDSSQQIEYDDYRVFLYSAYDYDSENYQ